MPAPDYPLATKKGVNALWALLAVQDVWRELTKAQREALLDRDRRVACRHVTNGRLRELGLIDGFLYLTPLGEAVLRYRPVKP